MSDWKTYLTLLSVAEQGSLPFGRARQSLDRVKLGPCPGQLRCRQRSDVHVHGDQPSYKAPLQLPRSCPKSTNGGNLVARVLHACKL